jgi:outer membrane protein OmpA-like peptidoglycan-associated protein
MPMSRLPQICARHVCAFALVVGSSLISTSAKAQWLPGPILEPWQTVEIEHGDRKNRLLRLSNIQGTPPPEFYEYVIAPEKHGLTDYPVPIPVLRVVFRDSAFFDFDKDVPKREAYSVVSTIAESLRREASDVTVFIAGHTDAIGSVEYNLQLGLRRSKAVGSELVRRGVLKTQVYVVSFGKAVPVATNDTDDGRALNRRVEFLFSARPQPIADWLATQQPTKMCEVRGQADNCRFTAVPVDIRPQSSAIPQSNAGSIQDLGAPEVDIERPFEEKKVIVFGPKVVIINLQEKSFSFPPPQGERR